jgi:hypothetical protein
LSLNGLEATWLAGQAAIALSFGRGLNVESNDLAGKFHRKVTNVRLPHASLKVLFSASSEHRLWTETADIVTDAYLDIYSSLTGWQDTARAQAEFIHSQDLVTGRARRMFYDNGAPSGKYCIGRRIRSDFDDNQDEPRTRMASIYPNPDYLSLWFTTEKTCP